MKIPFLKRKEMKNDNITKTEYKVVTETMNGFSQWGGNIENNDLIRTIIRVKAQAVGKAIPKHIRRDQKGGLKENPEPYIKELLFEPNPLMSMQQFLEKMMFQLELNSNAFALIYRDENGYPKQLIPIDSTSVSPAYDANNNLFLAFQLSTGQPLTVKYADVIHLRKDFGADKLFGTPIFPALKQLLEINHTIDEGIVNAIKNSTLIRWLLKFNQNIRPEDIKEQTDNFAEAFLSRESKGVAGVDNKAEAVQIKDESKMADKGTMDAIRERILMFFNINDKIIKGEYKEDDYTSFYETCIEPVIRQLSHEFTRKLFNRKERSYGNSIVFDAFDLAFTSMSTRLALYQMVDRSSLTPNEWRGSFNLAPYDGGDEYILRKDTANQAEKQINREDR